MKSNLFVKLAVPLAWLSLLGGATASAFTLEDIPVWAGSGTNRAALVVEWSTPESLSSTAVPPPAADKTLVWGFRFNGTATGEDMIRAVLAADHRFYAMLSSSPYGIGIMALGYDLNGNGVFGASDGQHTYAANAFTNGVLMDPNLALDASSSVDAGDLFWSASWNGPIWEIWCELGDNGGFMAAPMRGSSLFWTPEDPNNPWSGAHGQWEYSESGLSGMMLTNGSWVGCSVAAGGYEGDPAAPYNAHKHAPPTPEGTTAAYVCDTNDYATRIISSSGVYTTSPYDAPIAVLGRPSLKFANTWGDTSAHRTKIVEPPYNVSPAGDKLITEISSGGQITVQLGRKVYDDPHNPYGVDFIVYGNSFFTSSGVNGDAANLDTITFSGSGSIYGHPTTVSVSQDGVNWYHYPTQTVLYPDNAYRWDATNAGWTDEQLDPTKPLNPSVYAMSFGGKTVAYGLNEFCGAAGGTGYDLKASGLPWIQYVRFEPGAGTYTVIDGVAAVRPAVAGDALSISPANITAGTSNLFFQDPANASRTMVELSFASISDVAGVATVPSDSITSLAPIVGQVLKGYNIRVAPLNATAPVAFSAQVGLQAGSSYAGDGRDLEVYSWNGTSWDQPAFTYDAASGLVWVSQVSQSTTFMVGQLPPVSLTLQRSGGAIQLGFVSIPNWKHTVERSSDLVHWSQVGAVTPANSAPQTVVDSAPPIIKAFYRLRLNRP